MDLLLQSRADPNIADDNGSTPLVFACQEGFTDVASLLLEHGCDPDLDTGTANALSISVKRNHIDICQVLLD